MEVHVRANAEHPPAPAALQFLVVVGDVHPDEAEAEVGPKHVPELGAVRATATVVPDTGREIRLDADPRRWGRAAEPRRARDRGLSGGGIGGIGSIRPDPQAGGYRQQISPQRPDAPRPANSH